MEQLSSLMREKEALITKIEQITKNFSKLSLFFSSIRPGLKKVTIEIENNQIKINIHLILLKVAVFLDDTPLFRNS